MHHAAKCDINQGVCILQELWVLAEVFAASDVRLGRHKDMVPMLCSDLSLRSTYINLVILNL